MVVNARHSYKLVNCSPLELSHVPAAAQCIMASGEHSSGRFGGVSSGKSDVWKYFDKSADGPFWSGHNVYTRWNQRNTLDDQLTQQPQYLNKVSQYRKSSSTEYSNSCGIFGMNIRSQISVFVPALLIWAQKIPLDLMLTYYLQYALCSRQQKLYKGWRIIIQHRRKVTGEKGPSPEPQTCDLPFITGSSSTVCWTLRRRPPLLLTFSLTCTPGCL